MKAAAPATPPAPAQNPAFWRAHLVQLRQDLLDAIALQRGGQTSRADVAAQQRAEAGDDWAQADAEQDLAQALQERETAELLALDAALARLEAGTFGECQDCGEPIAPARLKATPTALRCIGCQSTFERNHGLNEAQAHPKL